MNVLTDMRLWMAIGVVCFSIFLWLATGLFSTGEPPAPLSVPFRLLLLGVFFLALSSLAFALHLRAQKTNAGVLRDISDSGSATVDQTTGDPSMLAEEENQLRTKFNEAAKLLKNKRFGRFGSKRHLYQLPWYIVLGSPGSGKTTVIRNSGLEFPLDELTQGNSLGGVGGTRNCDWWITDQAVLLDTAGRYTTQDGDARTDARGWKSFLDLLRKNRKQQPINGAVLVISTDELLNLSDDQWQRHIQTISTRLKELVDQLQMDFPVYLLVTKVDLLPGCREFFDSLDVDEQDQIWGTTLAPDASLETLGPELESLAKRLHEQLPVKLRYERDTRRRQAMYSFPWQMENLIARLDGLVSSVFTRQGVRDHVNLRGVYLTSAVQEGSTIERLFAAVTGSFGISGSVSTTLDNSRSLFTRQLFPRVIFSEAFLAGTNTAHERTIQRWRMAAFALTILAGLGLAFVWTGAFGIHRNLISEAKNHLVAFEQSPHGVEETTQQNLLSIAHLRSAVEVFTQDHPWLNSLGMYDSTVDHAANDSYFRSIQSLLAPTLANEISTWLDAYTSPDYQENLEALKAYLMLGDSERRDPEWFLSWMTYAPIPSLEADLEGQAAQHMGALFEELPEYELAPLDETTIKRTRSALARVTPSEAIYSRIKSLYAGENTDLRPRLGASFSNLFSTPNETDLLVSTLFTKGGYQTVDFSIKSEAIRGWISDRWVIGDESVVPNPMQLSEYVNEVKQFYSVDYILNWRSLLSKIDLDVPREIGRLSEALGQLSEPTLSPMSSLLSTVVAETSLPESSEAKKEAAGVAFDAVRHKTGRLGRVAGDLARSGSLPKSFDIPAEVKKAFLPYHNMMYGGVGSQNARTTKQIGDVRQWLNLMQQTPDAYSANNPSSSLLMTSKDLTQPFSGWTASLAQRAQNAAYKRRIGRLNSRWRSEVTETCVQALSGRFPFAGGGSPDTSLAAFSEFFGPAGVEEGFVDQYLSNLISADDGSLSRDTLAEIRRADRIRDAFFANGRDLGFTYSLVGVDVDDRIGQLIIESGDNQRVRFRHGPPVPLKLKWPDGDRGIKLTFMRKDGTQRQHTIEGPWAMFRAVASARSNKSRKRSGAGSVLVTFSDGEYDATFRISSASRRNPFMPGLLNNYQCRSEL